MEMILTPISRDRRTPDILRWLLLTMKHASAEISGKIFYPGIVPDNAAVIQYNIR